MLTVVDVPTPYAATPAGGVLTVEAPTPYAVTLPGGVLTVALLVPAAMLVVAPAPAPAPVGPAVPVAGAAIDFRSLWRCYCQQRRHLGLVCWVTSRRARTEDEDMAKNTIVLWYEKDAEATANFYAQTFPDSAMGRIVRAPSDFPMARWATS